MMLFLKFTLLSLLIAAPGLLVNGENMITCYGEVQHLHCDTGMISVKSSVYGRTDTSTCSADRPASQVSTTSCSLPISTIGDRCNGLNDCEVKTDLLGNPDPCFGTYKYYNTTYNCINGRLAVICEHSTSTLECGAHSIQILNANYGRADSVTCVKGIPSNLLQNTNCYAPNTFSTVATQCNGKKKCTVTASNSIYSDPCVGTYKYLNVLYICSKESVTCEGNTASLNCGSRNLMIISANYGRTDSTTCSSGRPSSQLSNTNCSTTDTVTKVKASCEGQSTCNVPATNSFFSDPCPGTYKYLKIVFGCV